MVHLGFWIVSFLISHRMLNVDYGISVLNVYYTLLFLIPVIIVFYFATFTLKFYLPNNKYVFIILSLALCLCFGTIFHFGLINHLSDWMFPDLYLVSFFSWTDIILITGLFLSIAVLMFLAFNRFDLQEQKSKVQQENNLIRMKAMESKIQPHFLFNSLNNIYSNIDPANKKAKDYLIKLSDSMRYMIYDIDAELVPLSEEIEYIKNYVELEKLRFDDSARIDIHVDTEQQAYMIAPLMLIPLVENCFKHVDKSNSEINIKIELRNDTLLMTTKNRLASSVDQDGKSGVGLATLQSRLKLLYPQKHKLIFDHIGEYYIVNLTLDLSL